MRVSGGESEECERRESKAHGSVHPIAIARDQSHLTQTARFWCRKQAVNTRKIEGNAGLSEREKARRYEAFSIRTYFTSTAHLLHRNSD
jgi:hypothetical protein